MSAIALFADELPGAEFSPCRTWRYILRRRWASGPALSFVLLNPSTADEEINDPTIRRCIAFAKLWGYGGLILGNLFALRSTDPKLLRVVSDPIGPDNDAALRRIVEEAQNRRIICGWGGHGVFMGRGAEVRSLLQSSGARAEALSLTLAGEPGHPLYLPSDQQPFPLVLGNSA